MTINIVDVSQDIKLIRYGYLRQLKQFQMGVYDSSKDDQFIVVYDAAWDFIKCLMQRMDDFEKDKTIVDFRLDVLYNEAYRILTPRFERSPHVSGLEDYYKPTQGTTTFYQGVKLKIGFEMATIRLLSGTRPGYAKVQKFPCEVWYRYGQKSGQMFCNANGLLHDAGPKTPCKTLWSIVTYSSRGTNFRRDIGPKIARRLDTATYYQNGKISRRNGPADIVYSISTGLDGKPKISNSKYFKDGVDITKQVQAAGGIDQIDDFTWEML